MLGNRSFVACNLFFILNYLSFTVGNLSFTINYRSFIVDYVSFWFSYRSLMLGDPARGNCRLLQTFKFLKKLEGQLAVWRIETLTFFLPDQKEATAQCFQLRLWLALI